MESFRQRSQKKRQETSSSRFHQPQPLVPCYPSSHSSSHPREIITVTKTKATTTTITITTPLDDPDVSIYLCIRTPSNKSHPYSWCKIDPTMEEEEFVPAEAKPPTTITPISYMPETTPSNFRLVPIGDSKNVYALGGVIYDKPGRFVISTSFMPFASVCDFSSNPLVWKQLPPMTSPKIIDIGVGSPSDGRVYVFSSGDRSRPPEGEVFDPSSKSWSPCPPLRALASRSIDDYVLSKEQNELFVFTDFNRAHTFNLFTHKWDCNLLACVKPPHHDAASHNLSSSVAVGDFIFKFHHGNLYALDATTPQLSFEPVQGLEQYLPLALTHHESPHKGYLTYIGNGKLCLLLGAGRVRQPNNLLFITCLKFWVGKCDRDNRWRAIFDRHDEYVTEGFELYDCFAL